MVVQRAELNSQRTSLLSAGEVVTSNAEVKTQQWAGYLQERHEFLTLQRPTAVELKSLHWIFTSHAELTLFDNYREELATDLYTLDRPDAEKKLQQLSGEIKPLLERAKSGNMAPMEFISLAREGFKTICMADTEVEVDPVIRGELRSYGKRKIGGGEWEIVYASHTCVMDEEYSVALQMMSGFPPRAYYGLSVGLPGVYQALCDRYDHLMTTAPDFEGRLAAEAFLQLLGTRVLHPFWDANGRTFMGHLAVMLEREGIMFREHSQAQALTGRLTGINDGFLRKVLDKGALGFIQKDGHAWMALRPDYRRQYMDRLRNAMLQAIDQGMEKGGFGHDFITDAAWQIKMFLLRRKLFTANSSQAEEITKQIEAKATNINKVPQPYREYFLSEFREIYLHNEQHGDLFDSNFYFLIKAGADEKCYRILINLMRSYETTGMGYKMEFKMINGFSDLYFRYGRIFGNEHSLNLAEHLSADNARNAINAWPAEAREDLFDEIWQVARGLLDRDKTLDTNKLVSAIIMAINDPATRSLLDKYSKCRWILSRIAESIVDVAGYSGKGKIAIEVAKFLLGLSENEIESALFEIHEDAQKVDWNELEKAS